MDDLIFHELWLSKQKFSSFENDDDADRSDDSEAEEDEDNDLRRLFPKDEEENGGTGRKKTRSITSNNTSEWMAVIVGVFFVAAVAGIASYQAYREDMSSQLSRHTVTMNSYNDPEDAHVSNADAMYAFVPEGMYDEIMLPKDVKPSAYVLYLSIYIDKQEYHGLVKITLQCNQVTDRIILHSSLTHNTHVEVKDGKEAISVLGTEYNRHRKMMIISLERNLTEGAVYSLTISFWRKLTFDTNQGFFLTRFVDGNGVTRVMAITEVEPTLARDAYPCFDEPEMKATFEIFIQHSSSDMIAVSNMPMKPQIYLGNSRVECQFEKTPPMSTYLVGWAVGNYTHAEVTAQYDLKIRVFAPVGRLAETKFAQEIAPVCIKYYEDNFKVNYSLPKLDLVPITAMNAAADEVWGMIVFLESSLLFDLAKGTMSDKTFAASTICHEISHQWFGDLVTMTWWNDLWLKESFANYLEYLPLKRLFPSWDIPTIIYKEDFTSGLSFDSSIYTHPIESKEMDPVVMRLNYDSITYEKGGSVIQMLASYIGEKALFRGVHDYLVKYKYSNANAQQFWQCLDEAVPDVNIVTLMNSWVNQVGYPVVLMTPDETNKTRIHVRQDRFIFQNETVTNVSWSDLTTVWEIPLVIKFSNDVNETKTLFTERQDTIEKNFTGATWYKANYGARGFYRVYYNKENWMALLKVLTDNHEILPPVDRASIMSDVNAFSNYKYMTLDSGLQFTTYLSKERHNVPLGIGLDQIAKIRGLFWHTRINNCTKKYLDQLISPALDELEGLAELTDQQKNLYTQVAGVAILIDKQPFVDKLQRKFLEYLVRDGHVHIPGYMVSQVYNAGIKYGQKYEWDALYARMKSATGAQQSQIIRALASTKNKNLLERYLNLTIDDSSDIPVSSRGAALQFLCGSRYSRNMTWKYVKHNFKTILAQHEDEPTQAYYVLDNCLDSGTTKQDLEEAKAFMRKEDLGHNKLMLRIVEKIKYNIELVKQESRVLYWFQERQKITC